MFVSRRRVGDSVGLVFVEISERVEPGRSQRWRARLDDLGVVDRFRASHLAPQPGQVDDLPAALSGALSFLPQFEH